jgi:hypothetical protein
MFLRCDDVFTLSIGIVLGELYSILQGLLSLRCKVKVGHDKKTSSWPGVPFIWRVM